MRASDADRDRLVDVLKAAFVQGQLAKDEFDLRVGQVLAAQTYADLDVLTADIPRRNLGARKPLTSPPDHRTTPAFALITQAVWIRRRPLSLAVGVLVMVLGVMLPSTVAFISGLLVLGLVAPQTLPCTPETAMVRMWRRRNRHQAAL